ncbi:5-formyltetrahydrofolate cyclo-ligase [Geothermobacter hydrogeniphilus]|nr:5-formyltetrahydrofolate cyclo-ligase [Geothermobacter hydrogeniphilus]
MPKDAIRSRSLDQRRMLAPESHHALSLAAQRQLLATPEFAAATVVGLYSPVRGEVDTALLLQQLSETGRIPVYPRVVGAGMEFVRLSPEAPLAPGRFGILEPSGSERLPPAAIDLLVVPGVAFDRRGHRLGYGRGYYDRALQDEDCRPLLAGLAFAFQLVDRLPAQPHDVQLRLLATDAGLHRF